MYHQSIITAMGNSHSSRPDPYLRFYLDQLGFVLAFDARLQSGERWVAVASPDGTAVLTLAPNCYCSRFHKSLATSRDPCRIATTCNGFVSGRYTIRYE